MLPAWGEPWPALAATFRLVICLLIVWEMTWKGLALWRAGRNAQPVWFVCIFIFNTLGILPILYIFVFSRKKEPSSSTETEK